MAFYDELGKKISRTGQGAVQKTKNFAEVTKLNASINDQERVITVAYTEIGKIYYQKYAAGSYDPEMAEQMQRIAESIRKIDRKRAQIRMIKGITQCKNCGADIEMGIAYCNHCGARVVPEVTVMRGVSCPNCGQQIKEGQVFCIYCGQKLDGLIPKEEKVYCPDCGVQLEAGAAFCMNCGKKVKDAAIQETATSDFGDKRFSEQVQSDTVKDLQSTDKEYIEEQDSKNLSNLEIEPVQVGMDRELMEAETERVVSRFCTECGTMLSEGELFCSNCGTKVEI